MNVNEKMIKNILTLRYDPSLEIEGKKFVRDDFKPKEVSDYHELIEKTIIKTMKDELENENQVSVALSGGIDSTLMTSLLRKAMPDITIEAI